jgi:hypothetical protein
MEASGTSFQFWLRLVLRVRGVDTAVDDPSEGITGIRVIGPEGGGFWRMLVVETSSGLPSFFLIVGALLIPIGP